MNISRLRRNSNRADSLPSLPSLPYLMVKSKRSKALRYALSAMDSLPLHTHLAVQPTWLRPVFRQLGRKFLFFVNHLFISYWITILGPGKTTFWPQKHQKCGCQTQKGTSRPQNHPKCGRKHIALKNYFILTGSLILHVIIPTILQI